MVLRYGNRKYYEPQRVRTPPMSMNDMNMAGECSTNEQVDRKCDEVVNKLKDLLKKDQNNSEKPKSRRRRCALCDESVENTMELMEHVGDWHAVEPESVERHVCVTCDEVFDTLDELTSHQVDNHGQRNETPTEVNIGMDQPEVEYQEGDIETSSMSVWEMRCYEKLQMISMLWRMVSNQKTIHE